MRSPAAWQGLLDRTEPGFDVDTLQKLKAELRPRAAPDAIPAAWWICGGFWMLLAGLALLLEQTRRWRGAWLRLERLMGRRTEARAAAAVLRRAAAPLLALLIWSAVELAAGAAAAPAGGGAAVLLIWVIYRLLDESLFQLLRAAGEKQEGIRSYGGMRPALQFAAGWAAGWLLLARLGAPVDYLALWGTAGHLILVLWLFLLLSRRDLLLALLPGALPGRAIRIAGLLYFPLLAASLAVALLWVAGYRNLAGVLLGRGWAAIGLLLALLYLRQRLERWGEGWLSPGDPESAQQAEAVAGATRRLITAGILLLAGAAALQILGLAPLWRLLLEQQLFRAGKVGVTLGGLWSVLLIMALALLLSHWLQAMLSYRFYPKVRLGEGEAYALNRLLHYALLLLGLVTALNSIGISPQSLALVLGGLSVGIGFGLQDIARNIASGIILLTSRQVKQGDIISLGGEAGKVREVTLRNTIMTNLDNVDILIPNSKLLSETVINWTHSDTQIRSVIDFAVGYGSDPEQVRTLALEVAAADQSVLSDPPPEVWLQEMGESGLLFRWLVWIDVAESVKPRVTSDLLGALYAAFQKSGIEAPLPQRELHLRSGVPWERLLPAPGNDPPPPPAAP